jgi:secreted trypsin-like serine protease
MRQLVVLSVLVAAAFAQGPSECGQTPIPPNTDSRIVGGVEARPNSWPWHGTWCRGNEVSCSIMCGGSVIDEFWFLTAAHCCANQAVATVRVRVGHHHLNNMTQGSIYQISRYVMNPQYNPSTLIYDSCLAQVTVTFDYGPTVQPVCLAKNDGSIYVPSNSAWNIGHGTLVGGGQIPNALQQVRIQFVDWATCNAVYSALGVSVHQASMLCAGEPRKGSCNGDSGGALVFQQPNGQWWEVGIVSWGLRDCAAPNYPTVFSRVQGSCDWFAQVMGFQICQDPSMKEIAAEPIRAFPEGLKQ